MSSREFILKPYLPSLPLDTYGKRRYREFKNRNSDEFSLKNLLNPVEPPLPALRSYKSRARQSSYEQIQPKQPSFDERIAKMEKIRKTIKDKLFEKYNPIKTKDYPIDYNPPSIRKVSPEKFIDSITYTKSDLNIPSKFIPTDRNTNYLLDQAHHKSFFVQPLFTKQRPKIFISNAVIG
jgi:hypothetical protein